MKVATPLLAPLFRSDVQGKLLAALFVDPSNEYSISDLACRVGTSEPTASREIDRAETAWIVSSRRVGKTRLVRADTSNPLYRPYSEIVLATYGAPEVVRQEFSRIRGIAHLFLFGSFAARYMGEEGPAPKDLDVLIVGTPSRNEVYEASERAEKRVGIPVNTTIRSEEEWQTSSDSFLRQLRSSAVVSIGWDPAR